MEEFGGGETDKGECEQPRQSRQIKNTSLSRLCRAESQPFERRLFAQAVTFMQMLEIAEDPPVDSWVDRRDRANALSCLPSQLCSRLLNLGALIGTISSTAAMCHLDGCRHCYDISAFTLSKMIAAEINT